MTICIVALFIFSILGIFSVKYRTLAKEAFKCISRMVTLRPCETNLEHRIRSKIITNLMKRTPRLAKFTYRNFKVLSWVFVIMFFVSLFYTAKGLYNLSVYGSCDPHSTTCIFNQNNLNCGSEHCLEKGCSCEEIGCEPPSYEACEGNCSCIETVCG